MSFAPFNVLFLCTGNSARSLLAEAILNRIGQGRFQAYSAGSRPKGSPHPQTLRLLQEFGYDTAPLRSKSWEEFAKPGAPALDFIVTVCDAAAGEACPVWPGKPATAHWGIADPAAVQGSDATVTAAFAEAYRLLLLRIAAFVALPIASLDAATLQARLRDIGRMDGATSKAKA
jgi:protein-tyrosine-phosphatase